MASNITVSGITNTSVTFIITLSSSFNSDNYMEVGVCNFGFDNGIPDKWFVVNPAFNRKKWHTTAYNNSTVVYLTVTELTPATSYTFYGYARAKNGYYYCIPEAWHDISVTTTNAASATGVPTDLMCTRLCQQEGDTGIALQFQFTVPVNADQFRIQMSRSENFESIIAQRYGAISDIECVGGYTYIVPFDGIETNSTFYVRARCGTTTNGVTAWGDYCGAERISTPPSRAIIDDADNYRFAYYATGAFSINVPLIRLYLRAAALRNYQFDIAVFYIIKDGMPINISYKSIGDTVSGVTEKTALSLEYQQFEGLTSGIIADDLTAGEYTGIIRVYNEVGGKYLQPVDENGNEIAIMAGLNIESLEVRPAYFEWDRAKASGKEFNLTAEEWRSLTDNINQLLIYKGGNIKSFSQPVKNTTLVTADIFNEIISAVNEFGKSLNAVTAGNKIFAYILNDIRDELNSIE